MSSKRAEKRSSGGDIGKGGASNSKRSTSSKGNPWAHNRFRKSERNLFCVGKVKLECESPRPSYGVAGTTLAEDPNALYVTDQELTECKSNAMAPMGVVQTVLDDDVFAEKCPRGWKFYFPAEPYGGEDSERYNLISVCGQYLCTRTDLAAGDYAQVLQTGVYQIDASEFCQDAGVLAAYPDIVERVRDSPECWISCLGFAVYSLISEAEEARRSSGADVLQTLKLPPIAVRLVRWPTVTALLDLKAPMYRKLVSVRGTVVRVGAVRPMCTRMAFQCVRCDEKQILLLPDSKYLLPVRCKSSMCRSTSFMPLRGVMHGTTYVMWQTVRIVDTRCSSSALGEEEAAYAPRTLEVELTDDLVNCCLPGDMVTVIGVVKLHEQNGGRPQSKGRCVYGLSLAANSVENERSRADADGNNDRSRSSTDNHQDVFSAADMLRIREIKEKTPFLFDVLVTSLAPAIIGNEMVKAGLLLALFGGTKEPQADRAAWATRNNIHVLMVGDPGLGKSQLLCAVANLSPRSVLVCGSASSAAGLTVTLVREGSGDGYALDGGALALSDGGVCCIDEFDKMTTQHLALLETMEQQSICVAKAGIVCTLPARTSIVAAGNPAGGRYNRDRTVAENLRMNGALVSRFDLVFIMLDEADEERDARLTEHYLRLHDSDTVGGKGFQSTSDRLSVSKHSKLDADQGHDDLRLHERLRRAASCVNGPIAADLLRVYIEYAKQHVHPRLDAAAVGVLKKFYMDLRAHHQTDECSPVTTRQLESLKRLTEARAKAELRETATAQDACEVVEVIRYSILGAVTDGRGGLDLRRGARGSGMSQSAQMTKFLRDLESIARRTGNSVFTVQQMKDLATNIQLQYKGNFSDFLQLLNHHGHLLKKGSSSYQLQCAS